MAAQIVDATKGVHSTDIIIAFMGPIGTGKSFFIDLLTGQSGKRSGNSLATTTSEIEATRMPLPGDSQGRHLVLVDTPGFDDTKRTDMQTLYLIGDWLKKTYKNGVKLSGLIYLHRIIDNHVGGTPCKNLRMFSKLCGDMAMSQVVLVSTMWGKVQPQIGLTRENELKETFWKELISSGADVDRLEDTTSAAAWNVVSKLLRRRLEQEKNAEVVLLQEEMVDKGTKFNETQACKALYSKLQSQLAEQKESLRSLLVLLEKSDDPSLKRELKKNYDSVQREFNRTFEEIEKLKVSIFKRALSFLLVKKARSKVVKADQSP